MANPDRATRAKAIVADNLPGLMLVRNYSRSWLRGDVTAGVVLAALLVPQGMAYSELAGLPAVYGLYATMVPLLVYALLGPSRILVLGPDSAVAPVVAAAIIPIAGNNTEQRVALAGLLAILVGIICILGGIAGFGFLTDLISKPVRLGYLAGIAVSVIVIQVPTLLGFESGSSALIGSAEAIVRGIDQIDLDTAVVGCSALIFILVARWRFPKLPAALVTVVVSILIVSVFSLSVSRVGAIPSGLPEFIFPRPDQGSFSRMSLTALAIALLAFADTSVLSRSYSSRFGEHVDQGQELRALGAANLATGFFQGFPLSSSSSRTPVAESAGSKSQLTGLIGAIALGAILVFASSMFENLPNTILAAIVIAAMVALVDLQSARHLAHTHRSDFFLGVTCFLGVAVFGVLTGIGIAIGLSLLTFLWRMWHPYGAVLGRREGVKGYHDLSRHPEAREVPGLLMFRFDAPIFFANANLFRERVLDAIDSNEDQVRTVVVAAEPITDLDSTAAEMFAQLDEQLQALGIELQFAGMRGPIRDRFRQFGLEEKLGADRFNPTLGMAVRKFVEGHDVEWIDWEERSLVKSRQDDATPSG